MSELINVYQFSDHARIQQGLVAFAEMLQAKEPTSRLDVTTKGWNSRKGGWAACLELLDIKNFFRDKLPSANWQLVAWFNILEPGGAIARHNHWQADFACAYHIKGPGPLFCESDHEIHELAPAEGRLAVFSGNMNHSVWGVSSTRYSLSINAHNPVGHLSKWSNEWRL